MSEITDNCGMSRAKIEKKKGPPPSWAERLKAIRIMSGKNQTEFAKSLGLSQPRFSNYENGEREPDFEVLNRIKKEYGASLDFIISGVGPPKI